MTITLQRLKLEDTGIEGYRVSSDMWARKDFSRLFRVKKIDGHYVLFSSREPYEETVVGIEHDEESADERMYQVSLKFAQKYTGGLKEKLEDLTDRRK